MILPDVLDHGLDLVLCGTAPSRASKEAGAYYAKPGNRFWPTLHAVGLTPVRLRPARYAEILRFGIGLTDLCKTEFGNDADLSASAFDSLAFEVKMKRYRPAAIAFDSKTAAKAFFGLPTVTYGRQAMDIDGMPVFVLPSPSGLAVRYWDVGPWMEAGAFVQARRAKRMVDGQERASISSISSSLRPK